MFFQLNDFSCSKQHFLSEISVIFKHSNHIQIATIKTKHWFFFFRNKYLIRNLQIIICFTFQFTKKSIFFSFHSGWNESSWLSKSANETKKKSIIHRVPMNTLHKTSELCKLITFWETSIAHFMVQACNVTQCLFTCTLKPSSLIWLFRLLPCLWFSVHFPPTTAINLF